MSSSSNNSADETFIDISSLPQRPSLLRRLAAYEDEVKESADKRKDRNPPRGIINQIYIISSDEDEEHETIAKSRKKTRVPRINCVSKPAESESSTPINTFTNVHTYKVHDSHKDDNNNKSNATRVTHLSNNSKEIGDDEVGKLPFSMNNSGSLNEKEDTYSNKNDTIKRSTADSNFTKTDNKEASHSDKSHTITQDVNKLGRNINKAATKSFRKPAEEIPSCSHSEVISISSDSEEENATLDKPYTATKPQQPTKDTTVKNMSLIGAATNVSQNNQVFCTAGEYVNQTIKVSNLRTDILRGTRILRQTSLSSLPDKGALQKQRQRNLETQLALERDKLKRMAVKQTEAPKPKITWEQLHNKAATVVPSTSGKQAMNNFVAQKTVTLDSLKHLHGSLSTCPDENTFAEDPKGIKVDLMPHQKRALAWLIWREGQKPSGGILADDMGLGKTLTMISLILATKDDSNDANKKIWYSKNKLQRDKGGTLVICPPTLIRQWETEIKDKLERNLLSVVVYHGASREQSYSRLAEHDVVVTSYKLAQSDIEKKGPLYYIEWKRIILDEAHIIRNHKSQASVAICALEAKSRWALTGTPVHNKELDLYALLKFLRCSPFNDMAVWKRWIADKNAGGQDRLNTVITSILLRRTKDQLQQQGALQNLPKKKFEVIEVYLDSAEKQVYQKLLLFSKTLFMQFLRQRAEKNPEFANIRGGDLKQTNNEEFNRMHKKVMQMQGNTNIKHHQILVLLTRLRQLCCHPSLLSSMLDKEESAADGIEEEGVDIDMLDALNNLNLDNENVENENPSANEPEKLNAVARNFLSSSNPIFDKNHTNQKLRTIQKIIEEKVLPKDDKIIIVSQFTKMLQLLFFHLKKFDISCHILDGSVPVHKRNDIVVNFNDPSTYKKVLLLSLTAGGVGLNLVGANHLVLADLHWNPQLEAQAQDRIYRVGQKKTVFVYKIVTSETIEEKIKVLQDSKLSMASDILSGVRPKEAAKLSLDDIKILFNVND